MNRYIFAAVSLLSASLPSITYAQTAAASARTREIAARFSKEKHVIKEKHGVRLEKYVKVVAEPKAAANPSTYSGTYRDLSFDFILRLRVTTDGKVEGSGEDPIGYEPNIARSFTLAGGKVNGALLTATKIYRDGKRENLEGIFMKRITIDAPNERETSVFGLGVLTKPMQIGGNIIDRLFYERSSNAVAQGNTGNL
jgi:hypothetical protein